MQALMSRPQQHLQFCKPASDAVLPTRYLFVGNYGPGLGFSDQDVSRIFSAFGPCQVMAPSADASHTFVAFERAEAASAAKAHLSSAAASAQLGRQLVIKFTDLKVPKVGAVGRSSRARLLPPCRRV